jgi:hypothetical protein
VSELAAPRSYAFLNSVSIYLRADCKRLPMMKVDLTLNASEGDMA